LQARRRVLFEARAYLVFETNPRFSKAQLKFRQRKSRKSFDFLGHGKIHLGPRFLRSNCVENRTTPQEPSRGATTPGSPRRYAPRDVAAVASRVNPAPRTPRPISSPESVTQDASAALVSAASLTEPVLPRGRECGLAEPTVCLFRRRRGEAFDRNRDRFGLAPEAPPRHPEVAEQSDPWIGGAEVRRELPVCLQGLPIGVAPGPERRM
jgi:hypothetical protein